MRFNRRNKHRVRLSLAGELRNYGPDAIDRGIVLLDDYADPGWRPFINPYSGSAEFGIKAHRDYEEVRRDIVDNARVWLTWRGAIANAFGAQA